MNRTLVFGISFSILLSCSAISLVFYHKHKFAFVDNYRVYNEFNKKKELEKDFDKTKQMQKAVLDSMKIEMEMLKRKFDSAKGNDAKAVRDQLEQSSLKYQKLLQGFENSNAAQSKKYNEQILNEMNADIRDFGKEKEFDFLMGANGNGAIMYAKDSYDVTDEVIKYVNKRYGGK